MGFIEYVGVKYDKSTKNGGGKWKVCCCVGELYHEVVQYYLKVDSTKLKMNIVFPGDMTEKNT